MPVIDPANPDEEWTPPVPSKPATITYGAGGIRTNSAGKGRFDLIPFESIRALALRLEHGADLYGDDNWKLCGDKQGLRRFRESMLRHAHQANAGIDDEDHLAAVMFNAMALIYFRDRPHIDEGATGPRVGG